jgi:nucleotide-binding universal stress UspA family protein
MDVFAEDHMYRKILVPLDGSKLAECALEHAKEIARGCGVTEIDLLTVVKRNQWWEDSLEDPVAIEKIEEDEKEHLQNYLEGIKQELQREGFNVKSVLPENNEAEQILTYARNNGVDLIVMSTHGRSGISRWAFGSVADKVTRASTVPVMVISPPGCRINTSR